MSKISKYVKLHKNILLEYIYNDGNLVSEPYSIIINSKDKTRSFISYNSSGSGNIIDNQLFRLDPISNKYGKIDTQYYSFLQEKTFSTPAPIRYDVVKIHLPINWTFGEYLGFYIKVFAYDTLNRSTYELSNFYFDMTDIDQQSLLNFSSPPLLFQEQLWGKNIVIEIPALGELSKQTTNGLPIDNSINANLSNGGGFNTSSPIFIDFQFISNIQTINAVSSYLLESAISTTIPQEPEFERLGLVVEHSSNGDFFEIYGTYNGTISGFKKFIDDAIYLDNRYYVQYEITLYEQNIRGKTTTITVTDSFNEPIEYRPIIKYSTTTAIIDVEMKLIDMVDNSYIIRKSSYGMLQDEVSKYSLKLIKINVDNAYKPKIYNIKNNISPTLVGVSNSMGMINLPNDKKPLNNNTNMNSSNLIVEQVKVPFPVLVDRFNIMAKSENSTIDSKQFYGFGKIQILLYPFDNIIGFSIATGTSDKPVYLDLTSFTEVKFIIRNDKTSIDFNLFYESGEIDLLKGQIAFKITQNKFSAIKKIFSEGINVFYITGTNLSTTSVIYTGLYKIYDDRNNVNLLNNELSNIKPSIILDNSSNKETALVTRKPVIETSPKLKPSFIKDSQLKNR